eukprot:2122560-Pyramimonas_sp.AAC.1
MGLLSVLFRPLGGLYRAAVSSEAILGGLSASSWGPLGTLSVSLGGLWGRRGGPLACLGTLLV